MKLNRIVISIFCLFLIVTSSFLLIKGSQRGIYSVEIENQESNTYPFSVFLFISKESCSSCLNAVSSLKTLDDLRIKIILPESDSNFVNIYEKKFGISVEVENKELRRIRPVLNPSMIVVSNQNSILLSLPLVEGASDYIKDIIFGLYQRLN